MNETIKETPLNLKLKDVDAKVMYLKYDGIPLNTTVVHFKEKRRVLSTIEGLKRVPNVANVFVPSPLSERIMTLRKYARFQRLLPSILGLSRRELTFLSTGVDMEKVAFCEQTYGDFHVSIIATAGARNNALRTGVDAGGWVETARSFQAANGTINMLLLTNVTLTWGAMARAIMTATEAKTAALQDLNYHSTATPTISATGTGTDSMIVVSGIGATKIRHTGGHTKIGELIGVAAKTAVTEALKKHDF